MNFSCSSKPKLCSVCERPSFLQCIDCATVYCSAICQVNDWENHRQSDVHNLPSSKLLICVNANGQPASIYNNQQINRSRTRPESKPSVQDRLKKVLKTPTPTAQVAPISSENMDAEPKDCEPKGNVQERLIKKKMEQVVKQDPSTKVNDQLNTSIQIATLSNSANTAASSENVNEDHKDVSSEPQKTIFVNNIKGKVFQPGPGKYTFVDGSKLNEGKIFIHESQPESYDHYKKLEQGINSYVMENPNNGGHKPVPYELVLAKYFDGSYYRAMCRESTENESKLVFIDYGNEDFVEHKNIMKLPEVLLYSLIGRNVFLKLASGRNLQEIDVAASVDTLFEVQEIDLILCDDYKSAIIDDKLMVFKN